MDNRVMNVCWKIAAGIACITFVLLLIAVCFAAITGRDENLDRICIAFLVSFAITLIVGIPLVLGNGHGVNGLKELLAIPRKVKSGKESFDDSLATKYGSWEQEKRISWLQESVCKVVISRFNLSLSELAALIDAFSFSHEKASNIISLFSEEETNDDALNDFCQRFSDVMVIWERDDCCRFLLFRFRQSGCKSEINELCEAICQIGKLQGLEAKVESYYEGIPIEDITA